MSDLTPSPDVERFAALVANNVVSAFERERDGVSSHQTDRDTLVRALVAELVPAIPGAMSFNSGTVLAVACNDVLNRLLGEAGITGPRVEAVDMEDGSVTMRG